MNGEIINSKIFALCAGTCKCQVTIARKFIIMILTLGVLAPVILTSALPSGVVYASETREVILSVKQTFTTEQGVIPTDSTFSYELRSETPEAPMPDGSNLNSYIFTLTGTREGRIPPIVFDKAGIYTYSLYCITAPTPGYYIDNQVYTIEIYVPENMDLISVIYKNNGAKISEIIFEHSYGILASDPAAMVDPPVKKTVIGNPATSSTFSFKLVAESPSNPMPVGSENGVKIMTIIGPGEAEFGTWSYKSPGTYKYTVSEINTNIPGYIYDKTIYTITDVVTIEDGQLVVVRTVKNNPNEEVSTLSFVNKYNPEIKPTPPNNNTPSRPNLPGSGPKTGDSTNLALWVTIFALSCAIVLFKIWLIWLVFKSSKRKED